MGLVEVLASLVQTVKQHLIIPDLVLKLVLQLLVVLVQLLYLGLLLSYLFVLLEKLQFQLCYLALVLIC